MKLSAVFARYLYQHKQLSLPGIGVFSIDPSVSVADPADKGYSDAAKQIKYEQKPVISPDEQLINFIRTSTGKIKPLAESDLDSYLSDGKILLNIGKPFVIEGIGSLMKTRSGAFEFTPGDAPAERMDSYYNEPPHDDASRKRTTYGDDRTPAGGNQRLLLLGSIVVGLVLIVWGGYALYHRNAGSAAAPAGAEGSAVSTPVDTPKGSVLLDSARKVIDAQAKQQTAAAMPGAYKFIIEKTASKERALKRYSQLKNGHTGVRMDTKDSTMFNLYFTIPASAADTTRIKDSLRSWYGRKRVFVEPG